MLAMNSMYKVIFLLCCLLLTSVSQAKVFYSKAEAMDLAFEAGAKVEKLSLFPMEQQIQQIRQLARVNKVPSLFTFYIVKEQGKVLKYAAIESHQVRTKPETLLVILNAQGVLEQVHTLAFHEPAEYQPSERWYAQLYALALGELSFNKSVQGITGATLSTRAALDSVRLVLAMHQVMVEER